VSKLLTEHAAVDHDSVQLRFIRFGTSSLDVEVFAYFFAQDSHQFLDIQGELLLRTMEVIEEAGTQIALPSQTLHLAGARERGRAQVEQPFTARERAPLRHVAEQVGDFGEAHVEGMTAPL